ncbi:ParB/RepB/Spo0J family partition protein [Delftia sp. CH05]|uniref:ParB/RepB/Spo0J family partition protein n=1 Tax=Delftia sp. CH05 TaxID=2692194 RepID=UPI00135E885F|nr:ParB/RepB/Spo0J family partition protein [Delftia sp. CH05]MXN29134.1 ParB/RepB/Spo0J family partition protein [Delftia sp. CH05]
MTTANDNPTAALPTPGAGALMLHVPVLSIARSLRNPRKHFDATKLQELAESIKATGVHQPILLRPLPESRIADEQAWAKAEKRERAQYELVAGERRWRASQIAGMAEIPAMIRPMSDAEALRAAVIENLQREDVTKLEEAEGYRELLDLGNTTAEEIAKDVGKSRTYIFNVMKVLDLCEEGRDALRQGKIDFSKAQLIARIPDEGLQLKALSYCAEANYRGDTPSYRSCAEHVQQNYMLNLHSAPFKMTDEALLPAAGSCKACPKRTGANPDLFTDVSADVCTDPKCYREKEEAHAIAIKRTAVERGQHIIEGREAKTLMPSAWSGEVAGYLRLDDKRDSPTEKPLRKLIGKAMERQGILPTLIANPHKNGELVAVITADQAQLLLKEAQQEEAAEKIQQEAQREQQQAKYAADQKRKSDYETQWRWDVLTETWAALSELGGAPVSDELLRYCARNIARTYSQDRAKKLCKLLDLGKVAPVEGLLQHIADNDAPGDLLQLLVMYGDVEYRHWLNDDADANKGLHLVAAHWSVDIAAVKAKTKANQRAAEAQAQAKAAAKASESAAPKADLPLDPAARAGESRAKGKAKKSPAARASAEPKTTAAEASAAIAAALQDQDQGAAAAAQGDDAGPVAADAAQGLPPSPAAADVDQAKTPDTQQSAPAQTATANDGQDSAHADTGAADQAATSQAPTFAAGDLVRVKAGLKGTTGRPRKECGRVGVVRLGDLALIVEFGAGVGQRTGFEPEELECYTADPIVGQRVRVLNPDSAYRWREGTIRACTADGWKVEFSGKPGTVAKASIFDTKELESLA